MPSKSGKQYLCFARHKAHDGTIQYEEGEVPGSDWRQTGMLTHSWHPYMAPRLSSAAQLLICRHELHEQSES